MLPTASSRMISRSTTMTPWRLWVILCMLLHAAHQPRATRAADDVDSYEVEAMINQLMNPAPESQMHAYALRNQLNNLLRQRNLLPLEMQQTSGQQQGNSDYDYPEDDKRSVAALAAQGLLRQGVKRSVATLAKNGQLPTPEPEDDGEGGGGSATPPRNNNEEKRYVGSLARGGVLLSQGKRNVGTLARDFQLPQNPGKRNLATLARLGLLKNEPKRNVAAVARYNSMRMGHGAAAEKRNLGALKGSPVHGNGLQQKREDEQMAAFLTNNYGYGMSGENSAEADYYMDSAPVAAAAASPNYVTPSYAPQQVANDYWWYPSYASYADFDWNAAHRAQKRYLDTSKDPELFGIVNGDRSAAQMAADSGELEFLDEHQRSAASATTTTTTTNNDDGPQEQKRHIGAVYRSGFLPSYRALRSTTGNGGGIVGGGGRDGGFVGGRVGDGTTGGRFSRSGRARQFVEYYSQHERLRQPIAAVCKRCFLPYRPVVHWGAAGIRGRMPTYIAEEDHSSIRTNSIPTGGHRPSSTYAATVRSIGGNGSSSSSSSSSSGRAVAHRWGTPPRITALHRRSYRRTNDDDIMNNFIN